MAFRIAAIVLILVAVAGAVLGYLSLGAIADISELPIGPVVVGIAAILAVFARMAQAEYHNSQQMERLKAIHYMIRDEIDRSALVPSRGRDFAVAEEEEAGSE